MSTYTKPGSEIYIQEAEPLLRSPDRVADPYGMMVADSSKRLGFKIAYCSICERAPIDFSANDLDLTISMDLHAIEHAWFEAYPPLNQKDAKKTMWMYYESLTPEMQAFDDARKERIESGIAHINGIQAGDE